MFAKLNIFELSKSELDRQCVTEGEYVIRALNQLVGWSLTRYLCYLVRISDLNLSIMLKSKLTAKCRTRLIIGPTESLTGLWPVNNPSVIVKTTSGLK